MPVLYDCTVNIDNTSSTTNSVSADCSFICQGDSPPNPIYVGTLNGVEKTSYTGFFFFDNLSANTTYTLRVDLKNEGESIVISTDSASITTASHPLNSVTNLSTVVPVPSPRATHTTWTKPANTTATFSNYILYIKGTGVNEVIHIYSIDTTSYDFSLWIYGCQTVTVDIVVSYAEGDSTKVLSSAYLGQRYPGTISALVAPFSQVDLKNKMLAVGEPWELDKLTTVNIHNGYKYVGLNRQYLPEFMSLPINKLSDLEGYPNNTVSVIPEEIIIDSGATVVGQLYTVSSRHRWKLVSTDISPGIFVLEGTSDIEPPENIYSSGNSANWTFITENTGQNARTGKLQFLYESVPCSGNFDTYMTILDFEGVATANNYVLVTQNGVSVVNPDPGVPADGTITSLHWVGIDGEVVPTTIPAMPLKNTTTKVEGTTAKYRNTYYDPTVTPTAIGYVDGTTDLVANDEGLIKTGRLAVDTTDGYSNLYTQGIIYSNISGVDTPALKFTGAYGITIGTDAGRIWLYDENIIKPIINDNRLHLLTYSELSNSATTVYVPVALSSDTETLLAESIYGNTAHVYVQKIKYLQLNLSAVHNGKEGISSRQRKVLSYGSTVYIYSTTVDYRQDTLMPGSWIVRLESDDGEIFIPPQSIVTW